MEFRILGGLEVRDDGDRRIPLGAGKQRALLAILLLRANEVVATERLIDELWGESPPETARKAVQVYVTRLRKSLGPGRIHTHEPGYVLELAAHELDLRRFELLVQEARELREQGEQAAAAATLREALALWHGPPLADFAYEPFAQTEIPRLEEQRLQAVEERLEADLALGHGADLVGELEALVTEHPYRERLRGHLMLALYRDGRQAEALAVYQQTRKLLVDELGIEPSPTLQHLHNAILRQEPALDTVLDVPALAAEHGVPGPVRPKPKPNRRLRHALALAGVALVAGSVAAGLTLSRGPDFLSRVDANAVGVIDAEAARIEAQVTLPGRPSAIAAGGSFIWIASETDGTVSRVDPDRRDVQTVSPDGGVAGLAYGGGSLWVTNPEARTVSQITPDTLRVVQTFPVGNGPIAVAFGEGGVWVANTFDGTVSRIDPSSGEVETIAVGASPSGIAVSPGAVWVTSEATGTVIPVGQRSGEVRQPINVGNGPTAVAVGEGGVWVANRQDGTLSRIDPSTSSVSDTIPGVGATPTAVAAGGGAVWVASSEEAIVRIDPDAGRIDERIAVESSPSALALADGKVWATALPSSRSHRGGVLRVEADAFCACIDPAAIPGAGWLATGPFNLAYDGLVAYRRVGGIAGSSLVPNLAERVPRPTDEGRTYVFELRPGVRYSDGTPVRASDFRSSLERMLTVNPILEYLYKGILGAGACYQRSSEPCDLSEGIDVDDAARTITIRLTEADPDFLHTLALPFASLVPAGTPSRIARMRPIPGTGPYRILPRDSLDEIRLVRNEHFAVWSHEARPDGYPGEIRFHVSDDFEAQLDAVERDRADLVSLNDRLGDLGPEGLTRLLTKNAGRLHSDPAPITFFMFLNTRVPPFDDLRVRRALNYAFGRREFVERLAHPSFVDSPCQVLPAGFSGFRRYCPYTIDPNEAGAWTAPDLARARALVAESGTRGMRVQVVSFAGPTRSPLRIARFFDSVLDRLGYRTSLKILPQFDPDYLEYVANSRNRAQIGQLGWFADFLAASTFFQESFSCSAFVPRSPANSNFPEICDTSLDAKMERAAALQTSDPAAASELWAEIDRELVDQAVTVPFASPRFAMLVSERVGNYQSHPLWGPLFDQLWVQ